MPPPGKAGEDGICYGRCGPACTGFQRPGCSCCYNSLKISPKEGAHNKGLSPLQCLLLRRVTSDECPVSKPGGMILTAEHASYVDAWCQAMQFGLLNGRPFSQSCIRSYKLYMNWFLQHFDCVSLANFKQALFLVPIEQYGKRINIYEAVSCFSRYLVQEGILEEGLPEALKRFRPRRHLPPKKITVTPEGIDRLLAACETPMDKLLVVLLSQTGLRSSEAANLKLTDLHLDQQFLVVTRAKWGKTRRVGLTQTAIDAIREFMSARQHANSPYLMSKRNGKPMDRLGILNRMYKLGRKSGVQVSPHALRRAFVTINANKGRPLPMLQIACGHSNITTTRSYCMTTENETIEAMKEWD